MTNSKASGIYFENINFFIKYDRIIILGLVLSAVSVFFCSQTQDLSTVPVGRAVLKAHDVTEDGGRCKQSQQLPGAAAGILTMDPERPDSLEGWVAVRRDVFEEDEKFKLGFIVQWNEIESKFALTCHNRTLQRRNRRAGGPAQVSWAGPPQVSWAGLFSVSDLRNVHQQLVCVADVLGGCFPDLSRFDGNIWDLLFPSRRSGPGDPDSPCRDLEKYFSSAVDLCGRRIVLETLFGLEEERRAEEDTENLQELKKKSLQEQVSRVKGHLRQVRPQTPGL